MKRSLPTIVLLAAAPLASAAIVMPVSGWVATKVTGASAFTGGSEATSSPVVTGLPGDAIAANFLMGGSIAATTASYSDITVTYNKIPEPSVGMFSCLAALVLLRRRRK